MPASATFFYVRQRMERKTVEEMLLTEYAHARTLSPHPTVFPARLPTHLPVTHPPSFPLAFDLREVLRSRFPFHPLLEQYELQKHNASS